MRMELLTATCRLAFHLRLYVHLQRASRCLCFCHSGRHLLPGGCTLPFNLQHESRQQRSRAQQDVQCDDIVSFLDLPSSQVKGLQDASI